MTDNDLTGRPVYVLGAGFSRAIHDAMPLTDALGREALIDAGEDASELEEGSTFEQALTRLSTSLPFLRGWENLAREARVARISASIAQTLDKHERLAASGEPPLWLLQLVSLWHAERAVVITFNYDTLVERVVSSLRPVIADERMEHVSDLHGGQIVYPAPRAVNQRTYEEIAVTNTNSMRLLKLHGSLDWFWAQGDGSTIVRDAAVKSFRSSRGAGSDPAAVTTLDRFLIPPVTSKDGYYDVTLVHTLWRTAVSALRSSTSITFLGYSMPAEDRVARELLGEARPSAPLDVVDLRVGALEDSTSLRSRVSRLGPIVRRMWEGEDAVPRYVDDRLSRAISALDESLTTVQDTSASVVILLPRQRGGSRPILGTLTSVDRGMFAYGDLAPQATHDQSMPPHAASEQLMGPAGRGRTFHTVSSFAEELGEGMKPVFAFDESRVQVVAHRELRMGRWPVLLLLTAPLS